MSDQREDSQVYDALDYPETRTPATEYVAFGLDGRSYRVELGEDNATKLREALSPYIAGAYQASGEERRRYVGVGTEHSSQSRERRARNKAIRTWASEMGYTLNPQGRIPDDVVQGYAETTQG